MNQDKEDKTLEQYLDGGSAESKRYAELGDELPPPELDARILAEAERAVKVTGIDSRRAPPFKAFAWAAIVVVSFSLMLNIVFDQAVQDPGAELGGMVQRSAEPAPTAPPPEEVYVAARKAERSMRSAQSGANDLWVAESGRVAAPEEPADVEGKSNDDIGVALTEAERKESRYRQDAPVPAAAPETASISGAGSFADAQVTDPNGADVMQLIADHLALPSGAEREQSLMKAAPADAGEAESLRQILDLYEAGRGNEALAALAEFRSEYPDHPVSEELRERGY
jgi:hypothetical protein